MPNCDECNYFFPIPEDAMDYAPGRGDCVTEVVDEKGKYWLSKPVNQNDPACRSYKRATR